MPRNPAAKKNQHNSRHENGLVAPTKRVTKQRSNGHLNGNVKPPLPDEPVPTVSNLEPQSNTSIASSSSCAAPATVEVQPSLTKRNSESSVDGHDQKWENVNGTASTTPRRSDMVQVRNKPSSEVNAIRIASTILKSCPAGDTVSLLIVLLALPSIVLTIVQALFASMTLMPPTNVSPVSFLSSDVFQGSAGSPSLGTMAMMDVISFGLWICLWTWAQNFTLDLAQIQIAMTLGNGNSSKSGSVNLFCFAIVLILHSIKSKGVREFFLAKMIPTPILSHPRFEDFAQFFPSESDFGDDSQPPSKLGSLFAIHILSQAFMAFVRRRVASTQAGSNSKAKRGESEGYAASSNTPEPLDLESARASASGVDYQPPPTPGPKDVKDKSASAKKRRRQANQVRSRQPFWAALASTKVHVLREVEHGNGRAGRTSDAPSLVSPHSQDMVWIVNVEPSTIDFEATLVGVADRDQKSALFNEQRPILVRINEAKWHSVSLDYLKDTENPPHHWRGTILGLAPDCTYKCSFNYSNDEEFASVMVKTPAFQDRDIPQSLASVPPRTSLRPNSPTSTLKNSIQTAEAKLSEARNRLTKSRRTHRAGMSRIEKDVETYNTRLKSGGDDNRQRQKLLQAERNIQQTEANTDFINAALKELEAIPEDDVDDYEKKKAIFEEQSKVLSVANEALSVARSEAKHELSCVNNELNQINSRKERLQGRQAKLAEQHDRITQANAQGMNEKERRAQESARIEADRLRRETELSEGITHMLNELRDVQGRTQNHWHEIEFLEKQAYAQRESMLKNSGPLTPEGTLPGTNPPQVRQFMFGGYQPSNLAAVEAQSSPFLPFVKAVPPDARRPRSNTNRSLGGISNFSADFFEDADPIPPMPSSTDFEASSLNGRKGSGSSRGKNNHSPAGVIGDGPRNPSRGSHSPGNPPGTNTW